jgi:hypothetical protein
MATLYSLPSAATGGDMFEPHVAIDPMDARRVAVVATTHGGENNIWCWRTEDAGVTWMDGPIRHARFGDGATEDPLVAYGPNGELVTALLTFDAAHVARIAAAIKLEEFNRSSMGTYEELAERAKAFWENNPPSRDRLAVTRLDRSGTWTGTVLADTPFGDREALAVDTQPTSPYRGHIYLAWLRADVREASNVVLARSVDGGRSFEAQRYLGGRNGAAQSKLLLDADGTVHVLWVHLFRFDPNAEDKEAAGTGIFHAVSVDGGETFEERGVVVSHGGADRVSILEAAIAPDGALLAVWPEADDVAQERGIQRRQTLKFAYSPDGKEWSKAATLLEPSPDTSQGLPAVAATDDGWHVLFYESDNVRTTVKIASSPFGEPRFRPTHDLASRQFSYQDFNLLGSPEQSFASDMVRVGDYIGLAGSGSTLAAAFVLPEGDEWPAHTRAYAWLR